MLRAEPLPNGVVKIVAAQGRIAAGGQHFEHALGEAQDGDVKGAAAQVVNRKRAFGRFVQSVGDGRSSGLVEQAQDGQAGQTRRVLGGLALRIVKVRGHRDHDTGQRPTQRDFGAFTQCGQNLSRNLHR